MCGCVCGCVGVCSGMSTENAILISEFFYYVNLIFFKDYT